MRPPTSTYRLQITAGFDLFEATRRLAYLHELGVDWVYLSPLLEAETGSTHGYDVLRTDRVDPARGGAEGLAALSTEAHRLGMGVLVDIVPNHVGVADPQPGTWWWDVLQHGPDSPFASYFDIDWAAGDGKVLLPVLADGEPEVEEAHYRKVSWRRADTDLNYRRFFAVNTLAAVRVEDPEVFAAAHVEVRRWFADGLVDGLRVDHPDGLRDPRGYLDALAELTGGAYVLVEKILEPGEALPESWRTAGTTGYDALELVDRVLTDPAGSAVMAGDQDWPALVHQTKRAVADGILGSEARRICRDASVPDSGVTLDAVAELLACFPVYRSYLPEGRGHLDAAFASARGHRPDLAAAYDGLEPILGDAAHPAALRFQQTSGMVMAKGVEDCAFYRYRGLTSLTEVGGDPAVTSVPVEDFHAAMAVRQERWPHAMTCLSTHDTKRGEDVRARIAVLAEITDEWSSALTELLEFVPLPDPGFAGLLWQAVLGVWGSDPDDVLRERLHGYAEKAMREAGDETTWTEPDEAYEAAVQSAVDAAFDDARVRAVVEGLVDRVSAAGWSNALSAKLLALTIPGVPDVYQGSEVAEQSLVDPDNRRPIDFDAAASSLTERTNAKQALVTRALRLRRDRPELFTAYAALHAEGAAADHVVAFDRGGAVTVTTRLPMALAAVGGWGETTLRIAGREHRVADLLGDAPAALLVVEEL